MKYERLFVRLFSDCQASKTPTRFQKLYKYFHLRIENNKPKAGKGNHDSLFKAQSTLDITNKFSEDYKPGCDLGMVETMIEFKGRNCQKYYICLERGI